MQSDHTREPRRPGDASRIDRSCVWLLLAAAALIAVAGAATIVGAVRDTRPAPIAMVGAATDGYAVWARNADGQPVRWDPCTPIVLVTEPNGVPPGAEADLRDAVDRLRVVTGLDLVIAGSVTERPAADRAAHQPARYGDGWAPVLVAWAQPGQAGLPLRAFDRGVAIPIAAGEEGDRTFVTGQVVFNADRPDIRTGFDDRSDTWGATIMHELMHLLGLDHVDDPDQLMWAFAGEGPVQLGAGDQAGLVAVGADHGCRPIPEAQDVEVVYDPTG